MEIMKTLKRYLPYLLIMSVFSILGMMCSFGAQPGGINKLNGFLAPMIGPWSRFLDPNGAYTLKVFDLYMQPFSQFYCGSLYIFLHV